MLSALSSVRCKRSSYSGDGCLEDTLVKLNIAKDGTETVGKAKDIYGIISIIFGQHVDLLTQGIFK